MREQNHQIKSPLQKEEGQIQEDEIVWSIWGVGNENMKDTYINQIIDWKQSHKG